MIKFGRELKMPKTCKKQFYKNIRVVPCKKTAGQNTKYSINEIDLKIDHLKRLYPLHGLYIAFAK